MCKRVVVSLFEDAYLPDGRMGVSMLSGALVSQQERSWFPTTDLLTQWFRAIIQGFNDNRCVDWDIQMGLEQKPLDITISSTPEELMSSLLDTLRSFSGDIGLFRDIAHADPVTFYPIVYDYPERMNFIHCVDHHWAPDLVYYLELDVVHRYVEKSSTPFSRLFGAIWDNVSSINYGKGKTGIDRKFYDTVELAQRLYLVALQSPKLEKAVGGDELVKTRNISDSWIAGMIAPIYLKTRPPVMITLRVDDPYQLVVIRSPARGIKDSNIPPDVEENAKAEVYDMLHNGIPLDNSLIPTEKFRNSKLVLTGSDYRIRYESGIEEDWETAKKYSYSVKTISDDLLCDDCFYTSITTKSVGVIPNYSDKLDRLIAETPNIILRRVLSYINTYDSVIEMNRLSRKGGGVNQTVFPTDVDVFQLLIKLGVIIPGCITPKEYSPTKFKVENIGLLRDLVDRINEFLNRNQGEAKENGWDRQRLSTDKKLWEHQLTSISELINNYNNGRKGSFIWIPVGMGKTLIVLQFIREMRDKLPDTIIYTLPATAVKSVITEFENFGIKYNFILPVRSRKTELRVSRDYVIKDYCINIIEHDHLRLCADELLLHAPNAFVIVDEVHKALNETQRTAIALELSMQSIYFIAMTGTPVIDANTYKLVWWLKQIVPFRVNEKNFWTASNSMIARKANTGVIVNKEERSVPFLPDEEKEYLNLVPPRMGGTNDRPRYDDWKRALDLSYRATDRVLIDNTLNRMDDGVMLVARDAKHQDSLYDKLLRRNVNRRDIFLLKNRSIFLTDEEVETGRIHDYKIVIVPIRKAEGYTLTRLGCMLSSVYPSNNATREQIEGRINRIGQRRKVIKYRIYHTGILTYILKHHNDARSISLALQSLAQEI